MKKKPAEIKLADDITQEEQDEMDANLIAEAAKAEAEKVTAESLPQVIGIIPKEKTEQVKWSFDQEARLIGCTIHQVHKSFDVSKIIPMDATTSLKAAAYYGLKQWFASNWASQMTGKDSAGKAYSTDQDKWASIQSDYDGLIKAGLEFGQTKTGATTISVVGKVNKKSDPTAMKVSISVVDEGAENYSLDQLELLEKVNALTEITRKLLAEKRASEQSSQKE